MVGNSKILTVSYGTFSCTLEGFDDPFSAMRSIAEYFRDLAAEDRFFGAEPPTPDAETLARLAQVSSARRVTARVGEHSVSLTEAPEPAAPRRAAARDAVLAEPAGPGPAPQTEVLRTETAQAAAARPAMAQGADDVTARLQRIRAAAARSPAADAGFEDQPVPGFAPITAAFSDVLPAGAAAQAAGYAEPAALDLLAPLPRPSRSDVLHADPVTRMTPPPYDRDAAALDDQDFADEALDPDDLYEPEPAPPSHAAPVRLVRARLVRRRRDEAAPGDDLASPASLPEVAGQPARALPQDAGLIALPDDLQIAPAFADLPVRPGPFSRMAGSAQPAGSQPGGLAAAAAPSYPGATGPAFAGQTAAPQSAAPPAAVPAEEPLPPAATAVPDTRDDELSRTLAAIRSDQAPQPGAALAAASQATDEWLRDSAPVQRLRFDRALSPAVSRSADEAGQDEGLSAGVKPSEADPRRERLRAGDDAVTRLLRETNSQLDDHDSLRRRSTIAHLKAAVAATRAEPARSPDPQADQDLNRYRDDLQRAVRGHRPSGDRRLAPLMLVSEQRVDLAGRSTASAAAQPVLAGNLALAGQPEMAPAPAQVADPEGEAAPLPEASQEIRALELAASDTAAAPAPVSQPQARGFAGFARQMGATALPELIEAAAAYACFVENRPHLTRPQLMDLAQSAGGPVASREDGLRAFGTLLRKGILRKTKRGQFSVSDETRFRPV